VAVDLCLRLHGHWDQHCVEYNVIFLRDELNMEEVNVECHSVVVFTIIATTTP